MRTLLIGTALWCALSTLASAEIVITEIHPTGSSNSTYAQDWFELTNMGETTVDITGWRFEDDSFIFGNSAALNGVTEILAGQSVVFVAGDSAVADAFVNAWFGSSVPDNFVIGTHGGPGLGSGGDAVVIYDSAQNIITSVNYLIATTPGVTFDNAAGLTGDLSTLSVVGVNGAFTSFAGGEIGSPGTIATAVPEPTTFAALAVGAMGMLVRRRKLRK